MPPVAATTLLLKGSNVCTSFAWYAHRRERPWHVATILSGSWAFFEYLPQVPANPIGCTRLSLGRLTILQEVIPLSVLVASATLLMLRSLHDLWTALCIMGAVCFVFRSAEEP